VYFFPKDCLFFVITAADAADRSCEEQRRMIDHVLCISRRMSSLLSPVLSPAGSFCVVIPVLHDCSLCNLLGTAIRPACVLVLQLWRTAQKISLPKIPYCYGFVDAERFHRSIA
jgi:hypothetical protein